MKFFALVVGAVAVFAPAAAASSPSVVIPWVPDRGAHVTLTNVNAAPVRLALTGAADRGARGAQVNLTLPAFATWTLSAGELADGSARLTGALRLKWFPWRLRVHGAGIAVTASHRGRPIHQAAARLRGLPGFAELRHFELGGFEARDVVRVVAFGRSAAVTLAGIDARGRPGAGVYRTSTDDWGARRGVVMVSGAELGRAFGGRGPWRVLVSVTAPAAVVHLARAGGVFVNATAAPARTSTPRALGERWGAFASANLERSRGCYMSDAFTASWGHESAGAAAEAAKRRCGNGWTLRGRCRAVPFRGCAALAKGSNRSECQAFVRTGRSHAAARAAALEACSDVFGADACRISARIAMAHGDPGAHRASVCNGSSATWRTEHVLP